MEFLSFFTIDGFINPYLLLAIIPTIIILFFFLRHDFVQLKEDTKRKDRRRKLQWIVFVFRAIMLSLVIVALAGPYHSTENIFKGDPVVHIVVDDSKSMELFAPIHQSLISALEKKVDVDITMMTEKDTTNIGDSVLSALRPYESVLLVSDGNTNRGGELGDISLYASSINATINTIQLDKRHDESSVAIIGPEKVLDDITNDFLVHIDTLGKNKLVHVIVIVDGVVIIDEMTEERIITVSQAFTKGQHTIEARIQKDDDHFSENNVFYKTVTAVSRPPLLMIANSHTNPMKTLLDQQYKVTAITPSEDPTLSQDLSKFYSVVINDVNNLDLQGMVDPLTDYIAEGDGLFVIGGPNAYNYGSYRSSEFETVLPVQIGRGAKKEGEMNIIVLIDISGSTRQQVGSVKAVDLEKALAVNVIKDLSPQHRVGVVAFNSAPHVVSPLTYKFEKQGLEQRVAQLKDGGGTQIAVGLLKSLEMFEGTGGSKNIILVSDGKTLSRDATLEAARQAANQGVKVYTIGVGERTLETVMESIADITKGIYFKATDASNIKVLFGDLEIERQKDILEVIVLDTNHFITASLDDIDAVISGFNQVVPKTTANMLVTTSAGDPLVTVWRLGLGRVASLSTDDGTAWAGQLLSGKNSKLLLRTMNYAIGDPSRKEKNTIFISDGRVHIPTDIVVRTDDPPTTEEYSFYLVDEELYTSTITKDTVGFSTALGRKFATNYPQELQHVGENPELENAVYTTGGSIFLAEEIDKIIEKSKATAQRAIVTQSPVKYPFIIVIIILFLIEIGIRRILKKTYSD